MSFPAHTTSKLLATIINQHSQAVLRIHAHILCSIHTLVQLTTERKSHCKKDGSLDMPGFQILLCLLPIHANRNGPRYMKCVHFPPGSIQGYNIVNKLQQCNKLQIP